MERYLTILEVSRKQDYIFASQRLRENAARSAEIAHVTGSDFFDEAAGEAIYREEENLVYTGGGHTVLQFASAEQAKTFACRVTETALRFWPRMELYVKTLPYDPNRTPQENLKALTEALEQKKARRRASFRTASFGVEVLDSVRLVFPLTAEGVPVLRARLPEPPKGWRYTDSFAELAGEEKTGKDNFIAVVHIDGNAMGSRVDKLYDDGAAYWESCRERLQQFSQSVQYDFEQAFSEMAKRVAAHLAQRGADAKGESVLPVRPIILAGDDVCFVTAGRLGLECARIFMEQLTLRSNKGDGLPYSSCAGVALVHLKFPFAKAYALAEELCSNAKRFGAKLAKPDEARNASMMDWHIEFGQLKDSLGELRRDYITEDSSLEKKRRLTLRPVLVTAPEAVPPDKTGGVRTYAYFRALCGNLRKCLSNVQGDTDKAARPNPRAETGGIARGKMKELRTALRQGELESRFFLEEKQIHDLLYLSFSAVCRSKDERFEQFRQMINDGRINPEKSAFAEVDGVSRCLYFDAIEMIDHFEEIEEGEK